MSNFDSDKETLLRDLAESRATLSATLENLTPDDFGRARRGSWPVSRILDHVLHSERLYTQLISVFNGKPVTAAAENVAPATASVALATLSTSRGGLLNAAAQVQEKDFYDLRTIGHEEYSALSVLENAAAHDREHADQIRKTLAES